MDYQNNHFANATNLTNIMCFLQYPLKQRTNWLNDLVRIISVQIQKPVSLNPIIRQHVTKTIFIANTSGNLKPQTTSTKKPSNSLSPLTQQPSNMLHKPYSPPTLRATSNLKPLQPKNPATHYPL